MNADGKRMLSNVTLEWLDEQIAALRTALRTRDKNHPTYQGSMNYLRIMMQRKRELLGIRLVS